MKNIYLVLFIGVLFLGCASTNPTPLNHEEIKSKLVGHTMYNNHEEFLIFDDGTFIYKDKDTGKKNIGTWYLRSALVDYKGNRKDDMICLAIGKTDIKQFNMTPCYRIFKEDDPYDNLYLNVSAYCNLNQKDKDGNIRCDFANREFLRHRISKEVFYEK